MPPVPASDVEVRQDEEGSEKAAPKTEKRYQERHNQKGALRQERVERRANPHSDCDQQRWGLDVILDVLRHEKWHKVQNHVEEKQEACKYPTPHHLPQTGKDQR